MANVVNKTTFEIRYSANTPDYPTKDWIVMGRGRDNSDLVDLQARGVSTKYWKVVSDRLAEMNAAEKVTADADEVVKLASEAVARLVAAKVDAQSAVNTGKTAGDVAPAGTVETDRIRALELKTYGA